MRSCVAFIFVVYEFKSDLKNILDLLCSLYEKKVSQCVISDQICSHFLRGDVYIFFFLAHPIVRFADSLQKKGDYSHQTSKKINAIQYNEKSDLFRSCLFSLLLRIWGFFCWKFEHPSTSCETVDLSFEVLQDYFANIYVLTYLAHRIQQPIYKICF